MDSASNINLLRVDTRLADVIREAYTRSPVPFRIVAGQRGLREQNALFAAGLSEHRYPQSAHNQSPSRAVDFEPVSDPSDLAQRAAVFACIAAVAQEQGVRVVWRGESSPHVEIR